MDNKLGIISIFLVMALFLIFTVSIFPFAFADISNNNTDLYVGLAIPLPFNSHITDQITDDDDADTDKYINNILPFP